MRSPLPLLLFAVALVPPGVARADCPLKDELAAGGRWLEPTALAVLERSVQGVAPEACAADIAHAIVEENGPDFVEAMLRATSAWPDDVAVPWLVDVWATSWFYRGGRREDALGAVTEALAGRLGFDLPTDDDNPPADPVDAARAGTMAADWPLRARAKYLTDWGPGLNAEPPPAEPADLRLRWMACLDAPADAPADPFDPLGLRGGLFGRFSLLGRCASAAVLSSWEAAEPVWRDQAAELRRQYSASDSDLSAASSALELAWGQGRRPGTGVALQPPVESTSPDPLRTLPLAWAALLLLGPLLCYAAPRKSQAW